MDSSPEPDLYPELTSADAEYARLLQHDPSRVDAWRMRSRIALQRRQNIQAAALLEDAVRNNPGHRELLQDLAALYLSDRDPIAGRPVVEQLIRADGGSPEHLFFHARLLWLEGAHEEAIALFAQAVDRQPGDQRFVLSLIQSLISVDDISGALHCVSRLPREAISAELLGLLTLCRYDASGTDAALALVGAGLQQEPGHPQLNYLYAVLLSLAGHPEQAADSVALIQTHERLGARWRGFQYAKAQGVGTFCGLGSTVLSRALGAAPATGVVAEFGVFHGLSLRRLARYVTSPVHGFDSFEGLPEDWKLGESKGSYSTHGRIPAMPAHVQLHRGWFEDTLPGFVATQQQKLRLVHVDCDLYSSTRTVLEGLQPLFQAGTVLLFDEYLGFEDFEQHEFRAWHEFVQSCGIKYEYVAFELNAKQAAVRITAL
jgi:hypothetical protein